MKADARAHAAECRPCIIDKPKQRFIVAEVSKNWNNETVDPTPVAVLFERIIAANLERGYVLRDWKFDRLITDAPPHALDVGPSLNETIIAVFELTS